MTSRFHLLVFVLVALGIVFETAFTTVIAAPYTYQQEFSYNTITTNSPIKTAVWYTCDGSSCKWEDANFFCRSLTRNGVVGTFPNPRSPQENSFYVAAAAAAQNVSYYQSTFLDSKVVASVFSNEFKWSQDSGYFWYNNQSQPLQYSNFSYGKPNPLGSKNRYLYINIADSPFDYGGAGSWFAANDFDAACNVSGFFCSFEFPLAQSINGSSGTSPIERFIVESHQRHANWPQVRDFCKTQSRTNGANVTVFGSVAVFRDPQQESAAVQVAYESRLSEHVVNVTAANRDDDIENAGAWISGFGPGSDMLSLEWTGGGSQFWHDLSYPMTAGSYDTCASDMGKVKFFCKGMNISGGAYSTESGAVLRYKNNYTEWSQSKSAMGQPSLCTFHFPATAEIVPGMFLQMYPMMVSHSEASSRCNVTEFAGVNGKLFDRTETNARENTALKYFLRQWQDWLWPDGTYAPAAAWCGGSTGNDGAGSCQCVHLASPWGTVWTNCDTKLPFVCVFRVSPKGRTASRTSREVSESRSMSKSTTHSNTTNPSSSSSNSTTTTVISTTNVTATNTSEPTNISSTTFVTNKTSTTTTTTTTGGSNTSTSSPFTTSTTLTSVTATTISSPTTTTATDNPNNNNNNNDNNHQFGPPLSQDDVDMNKEGMNITIAFMFFGFLGVIICFTMYMKKIIKIDKVAKKWLQRVIQHHNEYDDEGDNQVDRYSNVDSRSDAAPLLSGSSHRFPAERSQLLSRRGDNNNNNHSTRTLSRRALASDDGMNGGEGGYGATGEVVVVATPVASSMSPAGERNDDDDGEVGSGGGGGGGAGNGKNDHILDEGKTRNAFGSDDNLDSDPQPHHPQSRNILNTNNNSSEENSHASYHHHHHGGEVKDEGGLGIGAATYSEVQLL